MASGLYVSTERDNALSGTSKNSILRFDPSGAGPLSATHEWNLTANLPVTGPNLGIEAITWVPDSFLVAQNFFDETLNHTYNPSEYANHGTGLFFIGLETGTGIYVYALDHSGSGAFSKIATIATTLSGAVPGVMELSWDHDLNELWAMCDNGCIGRSNLLRVNPSTGTFGVTFHFDPPSGMPTPGTLNNEGFTIAAASECVSNLKPVYWADDSNTSNHALRAGTLPCTAFSGGPDPVVPEFPIAAAAPILGAGVIGGYLVYLRRRRLLLPQL